MTPSGRRARSSADISSNGPVNDGSSAFGGSGPTSSASAARFLPAISASRSATDVFSRTSPAAMSKPAARSASASAAAEASGADVSGADVSGVVCGPASEGDTVFSRSVRNSASSATVGCVKIVRTERPYPSALSAPVTEMARMESPPRSKKPSWTPTRSTPRAAAQAAATRSSVAVRGAV